MTQRTLADWLSYLEQLHPTAIDMGLERFVVASAVRAIVCQRLIRQLCPDCRIEVEPDEATAAILRAEHGASRIWAEKGCERCEGTGFRGRTGIHELLVTKDEIRELIVARANASHIRQEALKHGMITLRRDGWRKVLRGITTIEEVVKETIATG